jgi:hypothetical protein
MNFVGLVGIVRELIKYSDYAIVYLGVARPYLSSKEDDLVKVKMNIKLFKDEISCLKKGTVLGVKGRLESEDEKVSSVICERAQIF